MKDVSIIVVNYNNRDLIGKCLSSVYEHVKGVSFEIIVSDNDSSDRSPEFVESEFPGVILIRNGKNLGFGAANNRALERASGKYVFYLNSDAYLLNDAPSLFFRYWEGDPESSRLGALGCNLLDSSLAYTHSHGPFPTFLGSLRVIAGDCVRSYILLVSRSLGAGLRRIGRAPPRFEPTFGDVDYVTGAALFMRNDRFARFDERYFLYFEESDMERALMVAGKRRVLIDGPRVVHLCGGSAVRETPFDFYSSFTRVCYYLSTIRYLRKNRDARVGCWLLKAFLIILFLNPAIAGKTRKYLGETLKA